MYVCEIREQFPSLALECTLNTAVGILYQCVEIHSRRHSVSVSAASTFESHALEVTANQADLGGVVTLKLSTPPLATGHNTFRPIMSEI